MAYKEPASGSTFIRQSAPAEKLNFEDDLRQMIVDEIDIVQGTLGTLPKDQLRGFEDDIRVLEERFKIGVDLYWLHPKMPNSKESERFIVPLGDAPFYESYNAIMTPKDRKRVKPIRERSDEPPKWTDKCLTAGSKDVFNPPALEQKVVPLTEGEFDALAIMKAYEWKMSACALGGAGLYSDLIRRLSKMPVKPPIVIIYDNDENKAGEKNTQRGLQKLAEIRVPAVGRCLEQFMTPEDIAKVGGKVDANAVMQTLGAPYLKSLITRIIIDADDELTKLAERYESEKLSTDEPGVMLEPRHMGKTKSNGTGKLREDIQDLLDRINSEITADSLVTSRILTKSKGKYYCCPWCGSGTRQHGTGALQFYPDGGGVACHSCNVGGTIFQLINYVRGVDATGQAFFTQLRAVADEFGIKYDPKIFERKHNKLALQTALDEKVTAWLNVNGGTIDPNVTESLQAAEKFLLDITPEKLTAEIARSSVTVNNLALATFYDFLSPLVDKFYATLDDAKALAVAQIAEAKSGLTDMPSPNVTALARLSVTTLNKTVAKKVNEIRKSHKKFVENANAKREQADRQKAKNKEREADKAAIDNRYKIKNQEQVDFLNGQENDDYGRAAQFAFLWSHMIRFMPSREQWLVFESDKKFPKSGVWKLGNPTRNTIVMPLAAEIHKYLVANAPANPDAEFDKNVKNWRNLKCMNNSVRLAGTSFKEIQITADDLDRHPHLLLCKNGVVDLQTKKFYEQVDPKLYMTKCCNAIYNPQAESDVVYKFLRDIQPDEETLKAMQIYMGYSATGEINQQKIHFWKGEGANGKSTLLAAYLYLLGSYGVKIPSELIAESLRPTDANSATPALASLMNVRAAVSSELREQAILNAQLIKDITGGEEMPVRLLHCNYETFKPYCKLIICGNFYPRIGNVNDKGLLRRLQTIEFTETFEGDKADIHLPEKLLQPQNLSTLLNFVVQGAYEFYTEGKLIESARMKTTRNAYITSNDYVAMFVDEFCVLNDNCHVLAKTLIDKFAEVYPSQAPKTQSEDKTLRAIFEKKFATSKRKTGKGIEFSGIGLVGDAPTDDPADLIVSSPFNDLESPPF